MEEGEVGSSDRHRIAQRQSTPIHRVHDRNRNPEFAHALLGARPVSFPGDHPTVIDVAYANTDITL